MAKFYFDKAKFLGIIFWLIFLLNFWLNFVDFVANFYTVIFDRIEETFKGKIINNYIFLSIICSIYGILWSSTMLSPDFGSVQHRYRFSTFLPV